MSSVLLKDVLTDPAGDVAGMVVAIVRAIRVMAGIIDVRVFLDNQYHLVSCYMRHNI
jgi:hypothetical protein